MSAVHFTTIPCEPRYTRHMERYGLMEVVPTLTALLLSSLNDLQFFFVFNFYTLFQSFPTQSIKGKCTSRHLFPYGGFHLVNS